jgi:CheY-like chemotaxis protein
LHSLSCDQIRTDRDIPPEGNTVVLLPDEPTAVRPHGPDEPGWGGPSARGLRVLLALGDAETLCVVASQLCADGHRVEVVSSAPWALEDTQGEPADVVLLACDSRGALARQALGPPESVAKRKRPFVIVLTAEGTKVDDRPPEESGIDLHVPRPLDTRYLRGLLKRFQRILT